MLGKIVKVKIDRPINSIHPEHNDIIYEVNYGYVEGIFSFVDNEEIDAYIIDVDYPISEYEGKVIAIIHRDGDEDKLIVANKNVTKEEIYNKTYFAEKYFNSHIEMAITSKEDIIFDLKLNGFKSTDNLMLHSSLKSFGNIIGQDIIDAFIEYINEGLVMLPTHTWSFMKNDEQVLDLNEANSCVGALTNIALKTPGFKRSFHPTHSICAYGKDKEKYLALDLNSKTPVDPNGCFGSLWKIGTKILFLGAPLSKITFVHSIEEEMNVNDRFTEHIYHFFSRDNDKTVEYYMPKHYSTKAEHLSEHYAKLLPEMLKKGIAQQMYIGNSKTYCIDACKCREYVLYLLNKDIHIFDDYRKIED